MQELPEVIQVFYKTRKATWEKKNITDKLDTYQKLEKKQECDILFQHENWIVDAAKRISSRAMTTHPSKFTHPSTGVGKKNRLNGTYVSPIFFTGTYSADGLYRSGNVKTKLIDSVGNAAELDVEEFLRLEVDNLSILEHIVNDSELAKQLLTIEGQEYSELKKLFSAIKTSDTKQVTSEKIKQIYFPVFTEENVQYVLLSILTNSCYLFEQRKRIDEIKFSEASKQAKDLKKENKFSETGFRDLYNITTIGFGGTKPANISVLNNQNAGKAHLFECIPPVISMREIRLPTKNFFSQTLSYNELKKIFKDIHSIFINKRNVIEVRNEELKLIQKYIDHVIEKRWQVIMCIDNEGITLNDNLPMYQKYWLSSSYDAEFYKKSELLNHLITEATRYFFIWYEKTIGKDAFVFSDEEFKKINAIIKNFGGTLE